MDFITDRIEEQLDTTLSDSMFTKGIENMRKIYSALIMAILSYSENVRVLAPKKLETQINKHVKEMGKLYAND